MFTRPGTSGGCFLVFPLLCGSDPWTPDVGPGLTNGVSKATFVHDLPSGNLTTMENHHF